MSENFVLGVFTGLLVVWLAYVLSRRRQKRKIPEWMYNGVKLCVGEAIWYAGEKLRVNDVVEFDDGVTYRLSFPADLGSLEMPREPNIEITKTASGYLATIPMTKKHDKKRMSVPVSFYLVETAKPKPEQTPHPAANVIMEAVRQADRSGLFNEFSGMFGNNKPVTFEYDNVLYNMEFLHRDPLAELTVCTDVRVVDGFIDRVEFKSISAGNEYHRFATVGVAPVTMGEAMNRFFGKLNLSYNFYVPEIQWEIEDIKVLGHTVNAELPESLDNNDVREVRVAATTEDGDTVNTPIIIYGCEAALINYLIGEKIEAIRSLVNGKPSAIMTLVTENTLGEVMDIADPAFVFVNDMMELIEGEITIDDFQRQHLAAVGELYHGDIQYEETPYGVVVSAPFSVTGETYKLWATLPIPE